MSHETGRKKMSSPASTDKASPPRSRQKPGSACEECRRRKLRCDRRQPQCGFCSESGAVCTVTSSCPPRGPRRGHLKVLQARIGIVAPSFPQHIPFREGRLTGRRADVGVLRQRRSRDVSFNSRMVIDASILPTRPSWMKSQSKTKPTCHVAFLAPTLRPVRKIYSRARRRTIHPSACRRLAFRI